MNRQYILYNLGDAKTKIVETISKMETDDEYEYGDFVIDMSHLYHHVNIAWNARDATDEAVDACSQANFDRWRKMPSNSELLLED